MPPKSIGQLEKVIGYRFAQPELLERALTHRSWAFEQKPAGDNVEIRSLHNESLEFVGDAVLGLTVSEYLFTANPTMSEGELTLMKHHLVSTETLARLAKQLKLGGFMRVGRGEEKTGGRRKQALLADLFEAVLAAIFFDGGYAAAKDFVVRIYAKEFKAATPTASLDFKTLLQETLQADKRVAPVYSVVETEGPPHNRTFFVEAVWDTGKVSGKGNSIKAAEMQAAQIALEELKQENARVE